MSDNGTTPYFYVENCKNKGYVDTRASFASEQIGASQGDNIAVTGCDYSGDHYKTDADGTIHAYRADGSKIINQFVFDGRYTYYFQADGTAMRDRLTYHPDGIHIIYLDVYGHEVFTNFQYCPSVGYTCYFDSQGYLYKDQITFVGNSVYYLNANGAMEQSGWFRFANGLDYGFANSDGTLITTGFSYDLDDENDRKKYEVWQKAMEAAEQYYFQMLELGAKPEEARSILPNSLKTEIVMTMNLREWRHFIRLRSANAAHPQMRQVSDLILKKFSEKYPLFFRDLAEKKGE